MSDAIRQIGVEADAVRPIASIDTLLHGTERETHVTRGYRTAEGSGDRSVC